MTRAADLARLREMERAATPGEWSWHLGIILAPSTDGDCSTQAIFYAGEEWRHANGLPLYQQATANAAFIVELKNQFPALADRMERLEAALKLCIDEMEESVSNEGRLASFAIAIREARQALAEPSDAQGEEEE